MADVDYQLRRQVDEVSRLVVQLDGKMGAVAHQVVDVRTAQQETRSELAQLRDEFLAFAGEAQRTSNIQRAETRIGVVQDKVEHEFGHHKVVRRTAVGILQAFDVGLVSEETVHAVAEELMIQTPRYWLAPALVALAAWSADDQSLCERAVEEAFRRSPSRTSLFFALVLRRQDRQQTAVRWLRHYLNAQDPRSLGRDFAVILESISQGAFGPLGREAVQETLGQWREVLSNDSAAQSAQVQRWRAEIESYRPPPAGSDFPHLAGVSPQWSGLAAALSGAEAHQPILDHYSALMSEEMTPSDRLEDAVDDILDRLVSEYDNEELPLRRELAYNTAVVNHNGDLAAAQRAVDSDSASLEETLDYLTIQTTSALNPSAIGVSRATQRVAVAACHPWFAEAHSGFGVSYRAQLPADVGAVFDTSHNIGAQVFALPRWSGSFTAPMEELERSLGDHWDQHTRPFVDSLGYDVKKAVIAPAIVVTLVFIFAMAINPAFGLIVTALVGGIWGMVLHSRYQAGLAAKASAAEMLQKQKQDSLTKLRAAGAELTDWTSRFKQADAVEPAVHAMIGSFAMAGHTATPFDQRSVHVERSR
ncbi:MAG: hypothetical protein ACRDT0_16455 [Pseudonocardiaceae bacterium]